MRQSRHHHAFTLIELLVVVSIIALLISILLPALSSARDAAKRVVCSARIRSIAQIALLYSSDNLGFLPDLCDSHSQHHSSTNQNPYWYSSWWRDRLVDHYGMQRQSFYCPSNPDWNNDYFWNEDGTSPFTGPNYIVSSYVYYGNNKWTNDQASLYVTWVPTPDRYPVMPNRVTDRSQYTDFVMDLARSSNGNFDIGANHITPGAAEPSPGVMPLGNGGANLGNIDGSVHWVNQNAMKMRWKVSATSQRRMYW